MKYLTRKNKTKIVLLLMLFFISGIFMTAVLKAPSSSASDKYFKPVSEKAPSSSKIVTYSKTIIAKADSSIDESNPDCTNGSAKYLAVSGYYDDGEIVYGEDWTFYNFSLKDKPENTKAGNITLSFYEVRENATLGVYLVEEGWKEGSLKWNNKPNIGELIATIDVKYSLFISTFRFNVSEYISGDSLSICIKYLDKNDTGGAGSRLYSKEGYNYETHAPKITLYYEKEITITVTSPESGDSWTFGYYYIEWTASPEVDNVYIDLFEGSYKIDTLNMWSISADSGSMEWHISSTYANLTGNDFRIRVRDSSDGEIFGFSDYFTIDTEVDPSKGNLIGPGDPHSEDFNAENGHTYSISYTFTVQQTYEITIYDQENTKMMERELTKKTGSFHFEPDKTQVLSLFLYAPVRGEYGYVKLSIKDKADAIPGYDLAFLVLSLIALTGILTRKVKPKN